ncbi:MAG: hypothetical protein Q7U35_06905 [Methanobacteriaceae archaeon]|nr:hypothetical protein [Methanobacteriaceae archaeon]MDP3034016.1 hypothetical protein [Methanobacteriaceae archaeon]MDP3486256.1 hypothetical protein [Methanobacteriaceae archaeon]MDP3624942.1 hypothetical protein [Methanobacteriaceae archaeon]
METITYNLQSGREDYYNKIKSFTPEVLQASEGFIDSLVSEFQSFTHANYKKIPQKKNVFLKH